jgi:ADP-heptose:LPS heptosyltransferase
VKWDILPYINGDGMDIGCGDARQHDWMVGIDCKPGSGPKGPNHIRDATKLRGYFSDESQDYIFSSYCLNEIEAWKETLQSWWKLIKPDGYLILFLPIEEGKIGPKDVVDAMLECKPWQLVDARVNDKSLFQVYRKRDAEREEMPDPSKVAAVMKLGAHGDAIWASSVFSHLKEQGFYTMLWCQETTEEVLRHDPHIDKIMRFESRLPMGELGELFRWLELKYKNTKILIECVEGTTLPSPQKIQYHFPKEMRHKLMDFNYIDLHHWKAEVPPEHRQAFYPNDEEKKWANEYRAGLKENLVVIVTSGSSCSKHWPYAAELARYLLRRMDVGVVVLGDIRDLRFDEHPNLRQIGLGWSIRKAMTFVQMANVVVGQETGLLNCVAMVPEVRKVVLMTHSSKENLTRDWKNTATMTGNVPCYPCHRLHYSWEFCNQDKYTKASACQTAISVWDVLRETELGLSQEMLLEAAA